MGKAAYCSECKGTVWMTETGCENGHPMSCLRNVHETDSIHPSTAPGARVAPVPIASDAGRLTPARTGMAWWLKALILTIVWVAMLMGIGIIHTDVVLAGQITRQQGSEISRLYGMVCGMGIAGIWVFFILRAASARRVDSEAKLSAQHPAVLESRLKSQRIWTALALAGIGLLTVFNSVQWATRGNTRMLAGLITTRMLSFAVVNSGVAGTYAMLAAGVVAAVLFAVLGWLTYREHLWALRTGLLLYIADSLVFLIAVGTRDMVGAFAHVLIVMGLLAGYLQILALGKVLGGGAVGSR